MGASIKYVRKEDRVSKQKRTSIVLATSLFCWNVYEGEGVKYLADFSVLTLWMVH